MAASSEISNAKQLRYHNAYISMAQAMSENKLNFNEENLVNNTPPLNDVQRMILFNKPPFKYSTINDDIQFRIEEDRFIQKVKSYPRYEATISTYSEKEQIKRSNSNINTLFDMIVDGFGEEKRRTGESYFIHPMRIFMRGNSELPETARSHFSIYNTSLLARLLHDCKEDFTNFKIVPGEKRTVQDDSLQFKRDLISYKIMFGEPTNMHVYTIELEPNEMKLLELQLDALSIPEVVKAMPDGYAKSKKQIDHLLMKSAKIYKEISPIAAYHTLRIKLDDRIDNILTYYNSGHEKSTTIKLKAKLEETIIFFREVAKAARFCFDQFKSSVPEEARSKIKLPLSDSAESIIFFCYYLLRGGTYEEILSNNITRAREKEQKGMYFGDFLIPTLGPELLRVPGMPIAA